MAKKVVKKNSKSHSGSKGSRSKGKSAKASQKKDNSWVWSVVAVSVLVVILAVAVIMRLPVNTSNTVSGNVVSGSAVGAGVQNVGSKVLDSPVQGPVITWIANFLNLGSTLKDIIISLILMAILAAGIYDILELVSIFQSTPVKLIIAIGLGLIAGLTGWVNATARALLSVAALLGTLGVIMEILASIVAFILLIWGGEKAKEWAANRKRKAMEVAGIKAAGRMREGTRVLTAAAKGAEEAEKKE